MAAFAAIIAAALTGGVVAQDVVSGHAEVIDADIISFGAQRVILWGIDSPERNQLCTDQQTRFNCYEVSLRQLQTLVSIGEVACSLIGDPDPFDRRHGACTVGDLDLNAEMVRLGAALAYREQSEDYVPQEDEAKAAAVGLWQAGVEFDEPWVWRKSRTPGGFR